MTQQAETRPEWRDVNIDLLAEKLKMARGYDPSHIDWTAVAEAAVDELIDRPEREFQAQLSEVLKGDTVRMELPDGTLVADTVQAIAWIERTGSEPRPAHIGTWQPAAVDDWLPTIPQAQESNS